MDDVGYAEVCPESAGTDCTKRDDRDAELGRHIRGVRDHNPVGDDAGDGLGATAVREEQVAEQRGGVGLHGLEHLPDEASRAGVVRREAVGDGTELEGGGEAAGGGVPEEVVVVGVEVEEGDSYAGDGE